MKIKITNKLIIISLIISLIVAIATIILVYMQYSEVVKISSSFSVPLH